MSFYAEGSSVGVLILHLRVVFVCIRTGIEIFLAGVGADCETLRDGIVEYQLVRGAYVACCIRLERTTSPGGSN